MSSHPLQATFHLFSRRKPGKDHGTVDKSSAEQQICGGTSITSVERENWAYHPSASGSFGRQADR